MKIDDVIADLTGEQIDDMENALGCAIEETSSYKLYKALGYVCAKAKENQPDLSFRDYNKRTIRQIRHDAGLDKEDTAPKDNAGV